MAVVFQYLHTVTSSIFGKESLFTYQVIPHVHITYTKHRKKQGKAMTIRKTGRTIFSLIGRKPTERKRERPTKRTRKTPLKLQKITRNRTFSPQLAPTTSSHMPLGIHPYLSLSSLSRSHRGWGSCPERRRNRGNRALAASFDEAEGGWIWAPVPLD